MLLGFILCGFAIESKSYEKPGIIKKLYEADKTEKSKENIIPGKVGGQFIHRNTVSSGW
jgi:hypothetical protein